MDAEQAEQEVCVQAAVGLRQMPGSLKQESFLVVNEDSNRLIFINKAEKGAQKPCGSSASGHQHPAGTLTPLLQLGIQGQGAPDRMTMRPHEGAQREGQTDTEGHTLPGRGSPPTGTKSKPSASPGAKTITTEAPKTSHSGDLQTPPSFKEGCFTFDGVFNLDTGQDKLFFEHLRPLLSRMSLGYSVSLLLCEAHRSGPQGQSFVQKIYSDGKVQDLLNPGNQGLQMMDLPPLGLVVEKASEMVVDDSQAATRFYLHGVLQSHECLQQYLEKQLKAMFGTLLTVTLERRAEGRGLRRAMLRIFELTGGDELSSADLFSPLLSACSTDAFSAEVGFLSWVLRQLLTGSALTFVLFGLTLPGASGEEVLSALLLAERVKSMSKRVAPTCWDPARETRQRRAAIGELRDQLFFGGYLEQDGRLGQLGRLLKELQVLKSQSWKEKKGTLAAYETKKGTWPEAQLPPEQQKALHWQKEKSLLTLRLGALQEEQAEAERDLEELYQEHLREAEAQKHHILQVARGSLRQTDPGPSKLRLSA
ncbi:UNVERIFIED_CONTAM: hypothetical protein K2H54_001322 [Gekko kuhli]